MIYASIDGKPFIIEDEEKEKLVRRFEEEFGDGFVFAAVTGNPYYTLNNNYYNITNELKSGKLFSIIEESLAKSINLVIRECRRWEVDTNLIILQFFTPHLKTVYNYFRCSYNRVEGVKND